MKIKIHETSAGRIAEAIPDKNVINDVEDALDLIAESGLQDASKIVLYENQVPENFFDLKTGLAGEMLQKFSNYRLQLAIIGDFGKFGSRSLQDFIRECNRGRLVYFAPSLEEALKRLGGS